MPRRDGFFLPKTCKGLKPFGFAPHRHPRRALKEGLFLYSAGIADHQRRSQLQQHHCQKAERIAEREGLQQPLKPMIRDTVAGTRMQGQQHRQARLVQCSEDRLQTSGVIGVCVEVDPGQHKRLLVSPQELQDLGSQ